MKKIQKWHKGFCCVENRTLKNSSKSGFAQANNYWGILANGGSFPLAVILTKIYWAITGAHGTRHRHRLLSIKFPKQIHSFVCLSASVLKTNLPKMFFSEIIITPDYKLSKAKAKVSPQDLYMLGICCFQRDVPETIREPYAFLSYTWAA